MQYYRVKAEDDQRPRYKGKKNIGFYIAGEVVTEKEARKMGYDTNRMELIETSKSNTYWLFGARFIADESKVRVCRHH